MAQADITDFKREEFEDDVGDAVGSGCTVSLDPVQLCPHV